MCSKLICKTQQGARLGNIYCDPLLISGGHKLSGRQQWTPTPVQLQILERLFEQGNGTPTKQKVKEMTSKLSQHGQISETNVYNRFQNRRARSKRKQQVSAPNNDDRKSTLKLSRPMRRSLWISRRMKWSPFTRPMMGQNQLKVWARCIMGAC